MRLNAFIAKSGYCSRRKAVSFVKEGSVSVNGKMVREPWYELSEDDSVAICGKIVRPKKHLYLIFNKPRGVTTTLEDKYAKKKIIDFIPEYLGRVYPVGRLDKDSRGLCILTNDGNLCYKLTHPKFGVEKEYILRVKGVVDKAAMEKMTRGVREGADILKVERVTIKKRKAGETILKVIVHEGKKRHLRRLARAMGYSVIDLKRERIGNIRLGNLKEGAFKIFKGQF